MGSGDEPAPSRGGVRSRGVSTSSDVRRPRRATAGELAWIALLPCAALILAVMLFLGPPLGAWLYPHANVRFIPAVVESSPPQPEPTELARFLLVLTGPLLLAGCMLLAVRRARPLPGLTIARAVAATQALAFAFVVTCAIVQRSYVFNVSEFEEHVVYFTASTLLVAAVLTGLLVAGARSRRVVVACLRAARESRGRLVLATGIAAVGTVLWLLPAINSESTIGDAHPAVSYHMAFWLDEAFAVLDGRRPLVDFAAQYGSLWVYPIAGTMALLGKSISVYTVTTAMLTAVAMLAVFATIRRVVRSSVAALGLFLPFLATSLFVLQGPLDDRYAMSNLFGVFPMRYAGPLLVLWLLIRHLDGARPRRLRWVFVAAGLALLNNLEFGLPGLAATAAAILWSSREPMRRGARRLLTEATVGLALATVLVSALTLATAGSLPHLQLLLHFSQIFAVAGWGMLPMKPVIGMSTIIYLTYVAAIALATVRAMEAAPNRLLTGALAWTGVFGLGVGAYYAGRSHPEVLPNMFAPWALAVVLLFVATVQALAVTPRMRVPVAQLTCIFGFGVLVCSLAQMPTPWGEAGRLRRTAAPMYAHPGEERFVARRVRRGEAVAVLAVLGHRAAANIGVRDVTGDAWGPYLVTYEQVDDTIDRLSAAHGNKVFLSTEQESPELLDRLARRGYTVVAREEGTIELSTSG